ncbi:pilus assembly protein TadG-related protein [Virgibacillus sp. JSM 102003]|uniref:pilus assembly protein TadG-related protein n=1 Tax=Virgibacillus sp. JSM 102003 TaxID=1562108 RepID=UPI0035C0BF18
MLKRFKKNEQGNAIVLVALALGGLLLIVGLVIDGGHLFMTKSHLQKTANAAALSGAQEIPNSDADVNDVVDRIIEEHGETGTQNQVNLKVEHQLEVELSKDVPLFFSKLFGIEKVPIHVNAKAALNPMAKAKGAVPLGIDESIELNYGETYSLKVDAGDSEAGNFGVLALDGPGARLYSESLTYGYDENLEVGDIIDTQTGNIAGKTRDAINYRIDNCPYPDGEYEHRDCSRVMLVLVYQPYNHTSNQMKQVKITGFAYFYVTEPMSSTDDSINGIFIKRTGTGFTGDNGPLDRGAYAVKLIE